MISVEEVKEFLKNADVPEAEIQKAISLAYNIFVRLTNIAPDESNPQHRQALIILAVLELASFINLYYRQNNAEFIRTKELTAEVERLLSLTPKGAGVWQTI